MTKFKMRKKVTKINLRIISKPYTHLPIMTKTPVKFQIDRHKTVGEVAHTMVSNIHTLGTIRASKMIKFKMRKMWQKII